MNIVANYRPLRTWRRGLLLGVLGLFGAIAFLCSAISPRDDDVQQELVTLKGSHAAVANCRTARALPHRSCAAYATIASPMGPPAPRPAAEATLSANPAIFMAGIPAYICGLRSPLATPELNRDLPRNAFQLVMQ